MYFQVRPDCSKDISISEKRRTAHAEKNYSQESLSNEIILEFRRSLGDNHNIHEFFREEFSLYNDFRELKFCLIVKMPNLNIFPFFWQRTVVHLDQLVFYRYEEIYRETPIIFITYVFSYFNDFFSTRKSRFHIILEGVNGWVLENATSHRKLMQVVQMDSSPLSTRHSFIQVGQMGHLPLSTLPVVNNLNNFFNSS